MLSVLIWAQRTGRISIFGAENLTNIIVQIKDSIDWNKGVFSNLKLENGIVKLIVSQPNPSNPPTTNPQVTPITINDKAVQFVTKTAPRCEALAPNDWAMVSDKDTGMTAALGSPDLTSFASWMVPWSIYSFAPQDRDETYFLKVSLCMNNYADNTATGWLVPCRSDYQNVVLNATPTDLVNGYKMREFTTKNNQLKKNIKGAVIYKNYSTNDIGLYLLRIGSTEESKWNELGHTALGSAISIRCSVTLGSGTTATTRQKDDPDVTLSDKWQEAIMGYENVYDSNTGERYQAPTNSFWETGPSGAGYYKQVGNDYIKLTKGFGW